MLESCSIQIEIPSNASCRTSSSTLDPIPSTSFSSTQSATQTTPLFSSTLLPPSSTSSPSSTAAIHDHITPSSTDQQLSTTAENTTSTKFTSITADFSVFPSPSVSTDYSSSIDQLQQLSISIKNHSTSQSLPTMTMDTISS